jgi:hypothetical protein
MNEPPVRKEKGAVGSALIQTDSSDDPQSYHSCLALQACVLQWRGEAARLAAEYRRTGNPAHLRALCVHSAAMRAREMGVNV